MAKCKTCMFWDGPKEDSVDRIVPVYGICKHPDMPNYIAAYDQPDFCQPPDFGCTMHKPWPTGDSK